LLGIDGEEKRSVCLFRSKHLDWVHRGYQGRLGELREGAQTSCNSVSIGAWGEKQPMPA